MKEIMKVRLDELTHCSWNPRNAQELSSDNPELIKLSESLKENGLLQPICVWDKGTEKIVIAGNRRFAAAQLAGWDEITATVYNDLTEAMARLITREENENRWGISPLADAKLIKEMIDVGFKQQEIAARSGMSNAMVCRRNKLNSLSEKVLAETAKRSFDIKALEELSLYPVAVQDAVVKKLAYYERVGLSDVSRVITSVTDGLDSWWVYNTPGGEDWKNLCKNCPKCTGCQPDFFEQDTQGMGRCTDHKCYKAVEELAKREVINDAVRAAGGDVDKIKLVNWMPDDCKSKKANKKNSWAYVEWRDWGHSIGELRFGPDPAVAEAKAKAAQEDAKAEQAKLHELAQKIDAIETYLHDAMEKMDAYDLMAKLVPGLTSEQYDALCDLTCESEIEPAIATWNKEHILNLKRVALALGVMPENETCIDDYIKVKGW